VAQNVCEALAAQNRAEALYAQLYGAAAFADGLFNDTEASINAYTLDPKADFFTSEVEV
jgi:hypothetical protein